MISYLDTEWTPGGAGGGEGGRAEEMVVIRRVHLTQTYEELLKTGL